MEIAPPVPDVVGNASNSSVPVNNNNLSSNNRFDYDDDEDEDVCRICRNSGDVDNPLRYPCACSGSIKFVHQDCLLQWLNHSNAHHCEVYFLLFYIFVYFIYYEYTFHHDVFLSHV